MARMMHEDAPELFRAVVTSSADGRSDWTTVYGPFEAKRQASAAITRAKREGRWYWRDENATVTGHVQRAALVWEDVP